ncbi:MAG: UDP-N-acetylmuramoyl-L-alanyl-D-glutamate--2,6-diaminopimelate ligase [Planctomycetes bacterium]|nr:UDP-N-acetylmuramoyl-L-alanyl-D-glutamate--2,6-diaminopimelate ligase [Planctomycetota bacterium]
MIDAGRLFEGQALSGCAPAGFSGVARDSRSVRAGQAYIAMGRAADLEAHSAQATAAGAGVIVSERAPATPTAVLLTPHARWSFARASAAAHGIDRDCPPLLGVTGTKGKSTTVHCAWWALGKGAARVGTIGWHDGANERPNKQTTPPPEELHSFLRGLSPGCQGVALEVSSHGADQQRLAGLQLRALAYTGLGHDHLDYHGSLASYLTAKLKAMRSLEPGGTCIVNVDDATGYVAVHAARAAGARVVSLSFSATMGAARQRAHLDARIVRTPSGYRLVVSGVDHPLPSPLPGDFNAWNAAAGALMANAAGVPLSTALARLADMPAVPGRMELLAYRPTTYVDYAHTPESIASVIAAARFAHPGKRLGIVFGCGGDRDRSKRGPMGAAAAQADVMVITTDNSRSEAPAAIVDDIVSGVPASAVVLRDPGGLAKDPDPRGRIATVELDRGEAIRLARRLVGPDGVVVVAGKGHETTQDIQGTVTPWDDRSFVARQGHEPA